MIRKTVQALKTHAVHPYLLAVLPVLNLYHDNINLVSLPLLVRPLAIIFCCTLALVLLFRLLLKNSVQGGLIVSALMFFIFNFVSTFLVLNQVLKISYLLFLSCWLGVFLAVFIIIGFSKKNWPKTTLFLNAFTILAVAFLLFSIGRFEWQQRNLAIPRFPGDLRSLPALAPSRGKALPDIYYIILDAYGRDDVLRDIYHLDNDDFLGRLEKNGFFVARDSCANYNQTLFSLASSLNMRYVHSLGEIVGARSMNRRPVMRMISENDLVCFLKKQGYTVFAFDSLYTSTAMRHVDFSRKVFPNLNDFEITLINNTLLRPHFNALSYKAHIKQVLYAFAEMAELDPGITPKFVFAHVICPHPPFVFSRDGRSQVLEKPFFYNDGNHYVRSRETYQSYLDGYREQVLFVNNQLLRLIGSILAKSKTPPVIILQGDHGPGARFNHDNMYKTDLRERMGIFNAVHLPAGDRQGWTGRTSPVNTFRLILNRYFNARLPLLDDRAFFLKWHQPYAPVQIDETLIRRHDPPPQAR